MRMLRWAVVGAALAACARHAKDDPSSSPTPLYTGAACDSPRLQSGPDSGWREVRGSGFTYCVPPDVIAKDGGGRYWESRTVRFSWEDDVRVTGATRRVPFTVGPAGGSLPSGRGEMPTNSINETVDGKDVRVVRTQVDGWYRVDCAFSAPELKFYGRGGSPAAAEPLLAVCRSVRFTR